MAEAQARPEFPHAAGDELGVINEFFGRERLGRLAIGGWLEALEIENLTAEDDSPGALDFGGVGDGVEGFEEIG